MLELPILRYFLKVENLKYTQNHLRRNIKSKLIKTSKQHK